MADASVIANEADDGIARQVVAELKAKADEGKDIADLTDIMLAEDVQRALASLPAPLRDEVTLYAKQRLYALGWPNPAKRRRA